MLYFLLVSDFILSLSEIFALHKTYCLVLDECEAYQRGAIKIYISHAILFCCSVLILSELYW